MKADTMNEKTIELPPLPAGAYAAGYSQYRVVFTEMEVDAYTRAAILADRASRSRAASEPGEVAGCAFRCAQPCQHTMPSVLASMATSPASEAQAEGQKAVADDWYERHQAECTKDYGAYDEAAPIAARLRWWVPKSARHGRLTIEDDLLEAAEALATPTASMADAAEAVAEVVGTHNTRTLKFLPAGVQLPLGALLYAAPGLRGENAGGASDAARDVLDERTRQISVEGWTPAHDDEHSSGEMASAAGAYALYVSGRVQRAKAEQLWPWDLEWFKPTSRRRTLVKAGALIIAEIERIDRGLRIAEKGDAS